MLFANQKYVWDLTIYGDSRVVIDWMNGKANLNVINLFHWCNWAKEISHVFNKLLVKHIYCQFNSTADQLSKLALKYPVGFLFFHELMGEEEVDGGPYSYFSLVFTVVII